MRDSQIVPMNLGQGQVEFLLLVRYPDGSNKPTMIFKTWDDAESAMAALRRPAPGWQRQADHHIQDQIRS